MFRFGFDFDGRRNLIVFLKEISPAVEINNGPHVRDGSKLPRSAYSPAALKNVKEIMDAIAATPKQ